MELRDTSTTIGRLKKEVIAMCIRKGWGDENGIQHPQHIAAAMMVELMELLEHFMGLDSCDMASCFTGNAVVETSEEAADVMMYSLQILHTIGFDLSKGLYGDFSDDITPISELRVHCGACAHNHLQQALRLVTVSRYVLEEMQWMTEEEVQSMINGGHPEKRHAIGRAFVSMYREMFILANKLNFDVAGVISRKIGIVDKRVYSDTEPAR